MANILRLAPPLAFLIIALPAPLYFLLRYFTTPEEAGVYMLLALSSLAVGSVIGIAVALGLVLYRRVWLRRMRDKMAADGVTVDELDWFKSELTPIERRTLATIENQNRLLADAYRETLAARLTATRLDTRTTRELVVVRNRLAQASTSSGSERPQLEQELRGDAARLEQLKQAATTQRAEAETRLQSIAAAATRGVSEAETRIVLERLNAAQTPLALETARLEKEFREESRRELEARDQPLSRSGNDEPDKS